MKRKKFNQEWCDSNDPPSRTTIIEYMSSVGFAFHENPDKFGIDLISDFENPKVGLELERRSIWKEDTIFPYPSVHILHRKLSILSCKNVHFIVLNEPFTEIGICLNSDLQQYLNNPVENPNNIVKCGEYVFKVPRSAFHWIKIS